MAFGLEDLLYLTPAAPFKAAKDLGGVLSGSGDASDRADKYSSDIWDERINAKNRQYDLLNSMQAPSVSPEMERRIKALEDESAPGPLVSDPNFQGERATLAQGGRQALASVDNTQHAYGLSGGYANTGSVNDVYDRLGAQLAALGQHSQALKEQKRDVAAQARQSIVDNQVAYNNSIAQAKMAIESGDHQAAMQAIQSAYQARENIAQAQRQMTGQVIAVGGQIASAALGGGRGGGGGDSTATQYPQVQIPSLSAGPYSGPQFTSQAGTPYGYSRMEDIPYASWKSGR